jgi:hypothetical protein
MPTFVPSADQYACKVTREGDKSLLEMAPAEVDKATKIIGIAMGMETMTTLPTHIRNSPFVLRFFEDDFLRLEREDAPGSIRFRWHEGDELIVALQQSLDMASDERTLIKGARASGTLPITESPFI